VTHEADQWDDFEGLASELRQRVGSEFRREAEEVERLVELQRIRARTLSEVATEHMARGDRIAVHVGGHRLTGLVTAAIKDLLQLEEGNRSMDVNLGAGVMLELVERARSGGHDGTSGSRSFRARLAEYEQTGELLTLILSPGGTTLRGRIRVVGADHAVVEDEEDRTFYLALGTIGAVVRSIDPRPAVAPDGP